MPNIAIRQIDAYTTDLGTTIENLRFKIRIDKADAPIPYSVSNTGICSGGGSLFSPRALIAEYPDRSKIRFPMATPNNINLFASVALLIADGAVCVHLEGEKWTQLPSNIVGGIPTRTEYALPTTGVTAIETGIYDYNSDILGAVTPRYKLEVNPLAVSQAVLSCLANAQEGSFPCTINNVITPRALTVIAAKQGGGQIVRKTNPQNTGQDVIDCAANLYQAGFCVSYKGESIRNVQALTVNP